MPEVVLFAGPSAHGLPRSQLLAGGTALRAPVRRGDVQRLVESDVEPGVLVLCDGVFQVEPAVSHAEICSALDRGWRVWGVSSIGAIRAFEMRSEGMQGFGYVYEQFFRHEDFTDDELCLLHLADEPYTPLTEPLVNLRYALEQQRQRLAIAPACERRLLDALSQLWFGERSVECMRRVMLDGAGLSPASTEALLSAMQEQPVKSLDLMALMLRRPWLDP